MSCIVLKNHWLIHVLLGVCAEYFDETVSCRQTLLHMMSLEDSIKFSVEKKMRPDGSAISIEERIRPWTEALEEIRSLIPPISRTRALWKAGFILTITSAVLSSLLSLSGILLVSVLRGKIDRWILHAGAILDSIMLITAGILFIFAVRSSPRALLKISEVRPVEPKDYIGGAFVFLFMSASFKLASIGLVFAAVFLPEVFIADFCCHRKRKPAMDLEGACAVEQWSEGGGPTSDRVRLREGDQDTS